MTSSNQQYLARYRAGECEAVWAELDALGDVAVDGPLATEAKTVAHETMKRLLANVEAIARNLVAAKYQLLLPAVTPAKPDAAANLAALEALAGPLPLSLYAFYEIFDSVSLAQDVDAVIDDSPILSEGLLDELGRCDPLVVVPLAQVLEDARRQKAAGSSPIHLYIAPDPLSKGSVDDEYPDENPARMKPRRAIDADLTGGATKTFVAWLRDYATQGGFAGSLPPADRAHLQSGTIPL